MTPDPVCRHFPIRFLQSRDQPKQRGFTASGRTAEEVSLPSLIAGRHIPQHFFAGIALAHMRQLQHHLRRILPLSAFLTAGCFPRPCAPPAMGRRPAGPAPGLPSLKTLPHSQHRLFAERAGQDRHRRPGQYARRIQINFGQIQLLPHRQGRDADHLRRHAGLPAHARADPDGAVQIRFQGGSVNIEKAVPCRNPEHLRHLQQTPVHMPYPLQRIHIDIGKDNAKTDRGGQHTAAPPDQEEHHKRSHRNGFQQRHQGRKHFLRQGKAAAGGRQQEPQRKPCGKSCPDPQQGASHCQPEGSQGDLFCESFQCLQRPHQQNTVVHQTGSQLPHQNPERRNDHFFSIFY